MVMVQVGRNLLSQKAVQGPAMPEPDIRMLSGGEDIVDNMEEGKVKERGRKRGVLTCKNRGAEIGVGWVYR
jgi:hypothetical protein